MSESSDYVPAPYWKGHDFSAARNAYDSMASNVKHEAIKNNVKATDLIPDKLESQAESALVICCDVTGSMGEWPKTIFSKLPYLEHEIKEYLGENVEVSFCANGDSFSDTYPLQVRQFARKSDLKTNLEALIIEGNGGGGGCESYDLPAAYYAKNCSLPNLILKPVFIFIGDEGIYDHLSQDADSLCKSTLDFKDSKSAFEELKSKFNVYVVRKPYGGQDSPSEHKINDQWIEYLGADHVINMPDPHRVVDVIFGILAKETDRVQYFKDELIDRQGKDADGDKKINMVMKSLVNVHDTVKKVGGPKKSVSVSKSKKSKGNVKSISLMDDE